MPLMELEPPRTLNGTKLHKIVFSFKQKHRTPLVFESHPTRHKSTVGRTLSVSLLHAGRRLHPGIRLAKHGSLLQRSALILFILQLSDKFLSRATQYCIAVRMQPLTWLSSRLKHHAFFGQSTSYESALNTGYKILSLLNEIYTSDMLKLGRTMGL